MTPQATSTTACRWLLDGQVDAHAPWRRVWLEPLPFLVGSGLDASLVLLHQSVCERHAVFQERGGQLLLRDLGSRHGTFVNGQRVTQTLLCGGERLGFGQAEFRLERAALGLDAHFPLLPSLEWAHALSQFDKLYDENGAVPYFQPIVRLSNEQVVGYEVLARSRLQGLETAGEIFGAAEQLGLAAQISRLIRSRGVRSAAAHLGPQFNIFLNTHPREIGDPELVLSLEALRQEFPRQPLTLEIHEAAATSRGCMRGLRRALDALRIQLAYDDFGAGQARLADLVEAPPDYLKFDISMIRNVDQSREKRELLATLVRLAQHMGLVSVAEGIERATEARICAQLGMDLVQGYFYGKPAPIAAWTQFREAETYSASNAC